MSNTNKASGGYMTAWSEAERFKPNDGEIVLFHLKAWKPDEYSIGSYTPEDGIVLLGEEPVPYSIVDYWMRIPPKPNENAIPYIIGDDPDEWKCCFPAPKMDNDTKIRIEISAPSDFDPQIVRKVVKHLLAGGIDITNG